LTNRAGSVLRLATPLKAWAQRFAVLLLIGTAFALMMLSRAEIAAVDRLRTQVTDAVAPILTVASQPVESANHALESARELAKLSEINAALREENERLTVWHHRARQLETENAALRKLLHFVPEPRRRFVAARVIADVGGPFVRSVLVAAGTRDGVAKGHAALSGDGLAGRVAEVGQRAARVLLITDLNSRVPVLVGDRRDRAMLAGDNTSQPKLLYLPRDVSIKPGDRVMTSGHGGVLPEGLAVGIVAAVDDKGVRVRPYVDWGHLDHLRLVDYELPGLLRSLDARSAAAATR
jgi:rod shape-determining protein MreC